MIYPIPVSVRRYVVASTTFLPRQLSVSSPISFSTANALALTPLDSRFPFLAFENQTYLAGSFGYELIAGARH